MLDIQSPRPPAPRPSLTRSKLGFGKIFTDHMFVMDYARQGLA